MRNVYGYVNINERAMSMLSMVFPPDFFYEEEFCKSSVRNRPEQAGHSANDLVLCPELMRLLMVVRNVYGAVVG
jgi:hypothetical protein